MADLHRFYFILEASIANSNASISVMERLQRPIEVFSYRESVIRNSGYATCKRNVKNQGGQSRGQHDWVHRFPELVKSFITFVILSQILCSKVQKNPHIFLHKTVSKFLLGLL